MNKATRTFIWGILLLLSGASGAVSCIIKMEDHTFSGFFDWLKLVMFLSIAYDGCSKVEKTTY